MTNDKNGKKAREEMEEKGIIPVLSVPVNPAFVPVLSVSELYHMINIFNLPLRKISVVKKKSDIETVFVVTEASK